MILNLFCELFLQDVLLAFTFFYMLKTDLNVNKGVNKIGKISGVG